MPGRSVLRKLARWAIPKLESLSRLGKPIVSLTYLDLEPPQVLNLIYRIDIVNPVPEDVAKHRGRLVAGDEGGGRRVRHRLDRRRGR